MLKESLFQKVARKTVSNILSAMWPWIKVSDTKSLYGGTKLKTVFSFLTLRGGEFEPHLSPVTPSK